MAALNAIKTEKVWDQNSNLQVTDTGLSPDNSHQSCHSDLEQKVVTQHLKRHLEGLFHHLFKSDSQTTLKMSISMFSKS